MSETISGKRKYIWYVVSFFIIMAATCTFCFIWLIQASSKASQKAGIEMDTLYLRELTTQTIGHFHTSINSQFSQLRISVSSMKKEDLKDWESLKLYLEQAQKHNDFNFFSVVTGIPMNTKVVIRSRYTDTQTHKGQYAWRAP